MAVADCARIKQAEKQYMDAFNDELDSFKAVSYTHLTLPTNREV